MNKINIASLDLNLLKVFVVLWRTRNVTRAGMELSLTQSAVSHALKRLRERLGDELFVTARGGLLPTAEAERLIGPVQQALEQLRLALESSEPFDERMAQRRFRFNNHELIEQLVMPELLPRLNDIAPRVSIEVVGDSDHTALPVLLESGRIDLAMTHENLSSPNIESASLGPIPFSVLIKREASSKAIRLSLDEYLAKPHVIIGLPGTTGSMIDQALNAHGHKRSIAAVVQHFTAMPPIAAKSGYICNMPTYMARQYADAFGLSIMQPPLEFQEPAFMLHWHSRSNGDLALQWMITHIRSVKLA